MSLSQSCLWREPCCRRRDWIPGNILPNQLTIFAFGSTGVLLSLLVERYADVRAPRRFYRIALSVGVGMLAAGLVAHRFWIVSKLAATPTWYFYCCAIFLPLFALLYYLTDVRGHARWFAWVKPAGTQRCRATWWLMRGIR